MAAESDQNAEPLDQLLNTPDLAGALESDRFKQFLDHVPVAIAVSELTLPKRSPTPTSSLNASSASRPSRSRAGTGRRSPA